MIISVIDLSNLSDASPLGYWIFDTVPPLPMKGRKDPFASHVSPCGRMGYAAPFTLSSNSPIEGREVAMAKGQKRSNREKKKPKQDKNKKKGDEAPSPFALKLGTSYMSQYGKKH